MADKKMNTSSQIEERTNFLRAKVEEIKDIHKEIVTVSTTHKEQLAMFRSNKESLSNAKGTSAKLEIEKSVFASINTKGLNANLTGSNLPNSRPVSREGHLTRLEMDDLVSAE
jgi:hypothetical protein